MREITYQFRKPKDFLQADSPEEVPMCTANRVSARIPHPPFGHLPPGEGTNLPPGQNFQPILPIGFLGDRKGRPYGVDRGAVDISPFSILNYVNR